MIDKAIVETGCSSIETLISYIEDYIDWSNFTSDERKDTQIDIAIAKHFIDNLLEEYK